MPSSPRASIAKRPGRVLMPYVRALSLDLFIAPASAEQGRIM